VEHHFFFSASPPSRTVAEGQISDPVRLLGGESEKKERKREKGMRCQPMEFHSHAGPLSVSFPFP